MRYRVGFGFFVPARDLFAAHVAMLDEDQPGAVPSAAPVVRRLQPRDHRPARHDRVRARVPGAVREGQRRRHRPVRRRVVDRRTAARGPRAGCGSCGSCATTRRRRRHRRSRRRCAAGGDAATASRLAVARRRCVSAYRTVMFAGSMCSGMNRRSIRSPSSIGCFRMPAWIAYVHDLPHVLVGRRQHAIAHAIGRLRQHELDELLILAEVRRGDLRGVEPVALGPLAALGDAAHEVADLLGVLVDQLVAHDQHARDEVRPDVLRVVEDAARAVELGLRGERLADEVRVDRAAPRAPTACRAAPCRRS